ncbi:unnamed protein product [Prorocentrum cordatum]|uniref:5'-nucleotidase n=2 Tax=Prorocentrum cordatum TaxID=2364126 RepID=A0ABN9QEZ0_9DINO|nr:unnamed protein product [Polarella glacialis]
MPMCHDVVERFHRMPETFRRDYRQIWDDQANGLAEGSWSMTTWWRRRQVCSRSPPAPEMVTSSGLRCRAGCAELISLARRLGVPVLVVSAGIRELIVEALGREGVDVAQLRVRANGMVFGADGCLCGFEEPMVTSDNKHLVGEWEADRRTSRGWPGRMPSSWATA